MESIYKLGILLRMTDMISGPLSRMKTQLDGLVKRVSEAQSMFDKFQDYGRWIATAGGVGAAGIGLTISKFATLEEAQNRLQTTLMDSVGRVGPEFEKLARLADKLGTALPGSNKDMIEMFIALREQGVQTIRILDGVGEATAKFAVLMKVPYVEGATMVAKFTESLGIADRDTIAFMDTLQRLKTAGGVKVGDLHETMKYLGGPLKALGVQGLEASRDVSAAIGLLATNSVEGSQAGTNFAMALGRMAEISHRLDGNKMQAFIGPILAAKGIRLNFFDSAGNFGGIPKMIAELEKLNVLSQQDQINVLNKLFGEEGGRAVMPFVKQGIAGFDNMLQRMREQADMQTKITKIMSSLINLWETMTGTAGNFVAHVGEAFTKLTGLPGILGMMNGLIDRMDKWVLANPKTAGIIAGVVLAVTTLALSVGGLLLTIGVSGALITRMIVGVGALVQAFGLLRLAIAGIPAALYAVELAFSTTGLGVLVVVISAVIAVFAMFYNESVSVRAALDTINYGLGYLLGWILKFIVNISTLSGWFNMFDSGRKLISTMVDGIKSMAAGPVEAIKEIFQKIRNLLPFSDAKEGPLSQLTLSGGRIMSTLGAGITGAAPGLHRTMAMALAGAALTTSMTVTPAIAAVTRASAPEQAAKQVTSRSKGDGRKVIIQNPVFNMTLPNVSDGKSFMAELQRLVEGFDAN